MKKLDNDLTTLRHKLVEMGNLAEQMVLQATEALSSLQVDELDRVINEEENRLDLMQLEIDREAIRLLTIYSPVAADLRTILSISRMTAELERIGDHAVNLCESLQLMAAKTDLEILPTLHKMAGIVNEMVQGALNAFAQNDVAMAHATIAHDNMVDALNDQVLGELLSIEVMRKVFQGEEDIASALAQLLIARSLERMADQATNISEEVVYMVKGDDIRHRSLNVSLGSRNK